MYMYNTRLGTGPMMGRGTGQMGRGGAEHGSMMGQGAGQMGCGGAEHGSMMGRGTGQMGCWGVEHGSTSHLAQNEWRMPLRPLGNRNMDQTLVGLGTWGDPRLMVTSRTSSSSSSWYAHHAGSSLSEQVQNLEETVRRLQEENAQLRSRFERDMQVQLQQEVERQLQEHTQQRKLEANAREQAREREWQQREFDVSLSDTAIGIRSFTRMEEVIVPTPVQECLGMEVDKIEVDAKLTARKKPNRRKKRSSKNKLLAKGESTENPNPSVGAIASADQDMIMQTPAANGDGKSSISSTNALNLIASQEICSTAATFDGKSPFANTNATDLIASGDTLSTKVHEAVSGETGSGKTVTDSTTSKKRKRSQRAKKKVVGDVLSAKVDEIVGGETVPDKVVTDNTTPQKRKINKKKKKVAGDVLSAKVNEVSGETVPSKTTTNNTTPKMKKRNKKKRKLKTVAGDILCTCENIQGKVNAIDGWSATEVTEAISGEMVSGKTALTEAISGDWDPWLKKMSTLSGDIPNTDWKPWLKGADIVPKGARILSTCENIQGKVNAIDGWSATEVTEAISGEMVSGKTALTQAISGDWDPWLKIKSPLSGDISNTDWKPWPKGADIVSKGARILSTCENNTNWKPWPKGADIVSKGARILSTCENNTDWKPWPKGADIVSKGARILSTCENIQGKVNAIYGSSATQVTEAISGEMVSGKTALTEAISGDWDPWLKKKSPLSRDIPNTDWNPWPKKADIASKGAHILNTDWKQLSKKKSPLSGDVLNTYWKCGKNMVPELREKGIYMNEEKFGTYMSPDGYASEYDIAGAEGKECGWIYE